MEDIAVMDRDFMVMVVKLVVIVGMVEMVGMVA